MVARGRKRLSGDKEVPVPGLLQIPQGRVQRVARSSERDGKANDSSEGKKYADKTAKSVDAWPSSKEITAEDKTYRLFVVAL